MNHCFRRKTDEISYTCIAFLTKKNRIELLCTCVAFFFFQKKKKGWDEFQITWWMWEKACDLYVSFKNPFWNLTRYCIELICIGFYLVAESVMKPMNYKQREQSDLYFSFFGTWNSVRPINAHFCNEFRIFVIKMTFFLAFFSLKNAAVKWFSPDCLCRQSHFFCIFRLSANIFQYFVYF